MDATACVLASLLGLEQEARQKATATDRGREKRCLGPRLEGDRNERKAKRLEDTSDEGIRAIFLVLFHSFQIGAYSSSFYFLLTYS